MAHQLEALATPEEFPRAEEAMPTTTPFKRPTRSGFEVRGNKRGVEYYLHGRRINRAEARWLRIGY